MSSEACCIAVRLSIFCVMHISTIFHSAYYWKTFSQVCFFLLFRTLASRIIANSQASNLCSIVYYDLILQMKKTKQIFRTWLLRKQLHKQSILFSQDMHFWLLRGAGHQTFKNATPKKKKPHKKTRNKNWELI